MPVIAASSVDFPAPFGPSKATVSPLSTRRSTCCRAGARPYPAQTRSSRSMASQVSLEHGWLVADLLRQPVGDLDAERSEEHTSELQSQFHLVCRLLLEK